MQTTPHTGGGDSGLKATLLNAAAVVLAALIGAAIPILFGNDESNREDKPSASSPTVTVTVTATATVQVEPTSHPVTAGPTSPESTSAEPGETEPSAAGDILWLADLTPTGDPLIEGPRKIGDREYPKSLAHAAGGCWNPTRATLFELPKPYRRFSATVGVDTDVVFEFSVYVDRDKDGKPDSDEEVGTRTADRNNPGRIDVPLDGARRVILTLDTDNTCVDSTHAIWGDPKVY
ncbi:MAG: NPCBM/NEW2 domain-containing protein [Actinomycetes bacterium]|jgi:hypothetical protein|nr:MAG: hypothetical protein DIU60_20680 [Actinomycetota bacterium]